MPRAKVAAAKEYVVLSKALNPQTGNYEAVTPVRCSTREAAAAELQARYFAKHEDVLLTMVLPFRLEASVKFVGAGGRTAGH